MVNKKYNFTTNDIIGKVGFGYVYKATNPTTNESYATKEIFFKNYEDLYNIYKEIALMECNIILFN